MSKEKISTDWMAVESHIESAMQIIRDEVKCFGTFQEQYDALDGFRKDLMKYIQWSSPNRKLFRSKYTMIDTGDVLDWHVIGYFAPLNFKKISWGGVKRSPSEHVIALSNKLKENGTRLIYVALPCKGVIYPELAVDKGLFRNGASTAPQWRKMVFEMLESGVEVLDMFPVFQEHKECPLFSYEHNISPEGAELTARFIADYIKGTSKLDTQSTMAFSAFKKEMWYHPWQSNAQEKHVRLHMESCIEKEGTNYLPFGNSSNICIFGNCNLQAFQYRGSGIAANLAYQLQMDIDYLGRTLIFGNGEEAYGKESLKECIKRDIAICIGFPSGSFVRTTQLNREAIKRFIRHGRLSGQWSSMDLNN